MFFGAFCVQLNAQLEVKTTGDVKVSKNLEVTKTAKITQNVAIGTSVNNNICLNILNTSKVSAPYYGIKSTIKTWSSAPTSSIYAICGYADASATGTGNYVESIAGIYGMALKNSTISSKFAAGVTGMTNIYGGIGVYGGISTGNMNLPTSMVSGYYAGYFDGTVKVNGTLYATNVSTTSDLRLKENVQPLSSSITNTLQLLQPVSYTLKQDSLWQYDKDAKELQGIHFGLIAQDVQKVLPEIVYERGGDLSINYIELIPLLIKTVQELSAEVNELKQLIHQSQPNK